MAILWLGGPSVNEATIPLNQFFVGPTNIIFGDPQNWSTMKHRSCSSDVEYKGFTESLNYGEGPPRSKLGK